MLKSMLALSVFLVLSSISNAEDMLKVSGMPSIAGNSDNTFINFGGPSIKAEFGSYFGGLSFFPSLRHNNSTNEWTPILGAGLFMGHNNIFLVVPSYYYNSTWYSAIGLGYKF